MFLVQIAQKVGHFGSIRHRKLNTSIYNILLMIFAVEICILNEKLRSICEPGSKMSENEETPSHVIRKDPLSSTMLVNGNG